MKHSPNKTPSRARMCNFSLFLAVISNGILLIIEQFDGFKRLIILTQLIFLIFCAGVFLLQYCLIKLAAVMSGVNATNYTIISSYFENRAFCCTVCVILHVLLK